MTSRSRYRVVFWPRRSSSTLPTSGRPASAAIIRLRWPTSETVVTLHHADEPTYLGHAAWGLVEGPHLLARRHVDSLVASFVVPSEL